MSLITTFAKIYAATKLSESCWGGTGCSNFRGPSEDIWAWSRAEAKKKEKKDARRNELKDLRSQYPGHTGSMAERRIAAEKDLQETADGTIHYMSYGYIKQYYETVISYLNKRLKKKNGANLFESSLTTFFGRIYEIAILRESCYGDGGASCGYSRTSPLTKAERAANKVAQQKLDAQRKIEQQKVYKENVATCKSLAKKIVYLCDLLDIDASLYIITT